MENRSLGIIGGMGPKATSVFFDKIIENTKAKKDQEHIDIVILNHATIPDRTKAILEKNEVEFLEAIKKDIDILEYAGVANIAIPCNTSHYFYDQVQEMTSINIIHMIDETVKEIFHTYGEGSKVGILATKGTINSGIYEEKCNNYNMKLHVPNEDDQKKVMEIIYNHVKSDLIVDASDLETLIEKLIFEENCSCVILACTELSCIELGTEVAKYCIDAMDVLVRKSIQLSGKQLNNNVLSNK